MSTRVLHEDDDLLVVDKPAGIAVHGGAGETKKTLLDILGEGRSDTLTLVHRLDKATSGIILVAKRPEVASAMAAQWDSTQKNYVALAFGRIEERVIATPIEDKHGGKQSALTIARPLQQLDGATLVDVTIHTGRKHQIRKHLASIGHPVVMDDKHGDFAKNKAFVQAVRTKGGKRPRHLFLASVRITLPDGRAFEAPLPAAWREVLRGLGARVDELEFVS